ncbi:MAG TPA: hypothetical protein VFO10_11125 [Oligoflexus sp.]|uniref:hypothetical protein n=1 Tax=Oligoflexus sp. TaxID=1971216 RepID=UPI002D80511E|nr:hypothetical protein [Oligoflexus sp.]HET9237796.1 hypothetical protein [Oligoflexus sp.]
MKNSKAGIFSLGLLLAFGGGPLQAQAPAPKEGYQYPELLVVPRASQRLATLANQESKSRARTHFVLQAPAFFTLLAGASAMSMKEAKSKEAAAIASGIGLGWLVGTFGLGAMYTPYRTAQQDIAALGDKTQEQSLAKERRAEEALYFPAYVMRRVQYIAAFTNFAGAIAITSLPEENDKVKAVAGVAAVMAFLPLVFDHPWITNYDQQQDYKKRIYGPVAELTLLPEVSHAQPLEPRISWVPGFAYSLRF